MTPFVWRDGTIEERPDPDFSREWWFIDAPTEPPMFAMMLAPIADPGNWSKRHSFKRVSWCWGLGEKMIGMFVYIEDDSQKLIDAVNAWFRGGVA
jgi:hypothetical protein